jgi:hypothetical protein
MAQAVKIIAFCIILALALHYVPILFNGLEVFLPKAIEFFGSTSFVPFPDAM